MSDVIMDESAVAGLLQETFVAAELEHRGTKVQELAKELAPVKTGYLRDHIIVEMSIDDEGPVCKIISLAPYSLYMELGTRYIYPRSFLRPAMAAAGDMASFVSSLIGPTLNRGTGS